MGKPYSMDLRERAVGAVEDGGSRRQAAARFGVAASTVIHWVNRVAQTGSAAPARPGRRPGGKIAGEHRAWLIARCKPGNFTLRGLVAELAERGLKVDYKTMWKFVHAESLTFKKKSQAASEQDREDVARRRRQWRHYQGLIDAARLVFVDETWTKTNMAPLRGWSLRGRRLRSQAPHRRWSTMTFVAALRCDRIEAPWVVDGPINGERFRIYVEKVLAPTLRPGDLVIMDNLGSHKGKAVRAAIRKVGAKLFLLPKYSPDLNPIEQVFAKLKHLLRKACARTREAVCDAIGEILGAYTAQECANYLRNSGYDRT